MLYGRDDDAAFERVVNTPPRGIGAKTLEIIRGKARDSECSMWKASTLLIEEGKFSPKAMGSINGFMLAFETLENEVADLSLKDLVDHTLKSSGLIEHHKKEPGEKG